MIHINLLPVRQIKKKIQAQKTIIGLGVTLVAVLAVLVLVALFLKFQINELQTSIAQFNQEKAKYQTTINQIEQLKKDQALLETKLNTISELKKGSQLTVRVMDEIANLTPSSRVWLGSMTFSSGGALNISGIALDNATIADYMDAIITSPFFENVELAGTSNAAVQGRLLKSFSLAIRVVNPIEQEEEETPNS